MNNTQLAQKIVTDINKLKTDKNGFVTGKYRLQQSKSGNVNIRFAESAIKSFIDGEKRNMLLNGSSIGFTPLCQTLADAKTIDAVLLTYRYNAKKERIELDQKARQQMLAAFSTRIKKAFAPMYGLAESAVKSINLSAEQVLQIVKAAASHYVRNTQEYVAPIKIVKPAKTATKPAQKQTRKSQKPAAQATV